MKRPVWLTPSNMVKIACELGEVNSFNLGYNRRRKVEGKMQKVPCSRGYELCHTVPIFLVKKRSLNEGMNSGIWVDLRVIKEVNESTCSRLPTKTHLADFPTLLKRSPSS